MSEINYSIKGSFNQFTTLASVVASTYTYAVSRGIDAQRIQAVAGISRLDLFDPEARLPEEAASLIWTLLRKAYPQQTLTLHMASGTPWTYFGSLAQCVQYANTLRSMLQTFIRYRAALSDRLCLTLAESDTEATFRFYHPNDEIDRGCSTQVTLAMLKGLISSSIGIDDFLVRVELTHSPCQPQQAYDTFFSASVYFQRPHNALVFHKAALDLPVLQHDPHLFQYVQGNLDLQLKACRQPEGSSPMSELQNTIARNAATGEYTAEALARQMNMSLRTLQRVAKDHGFTIRQLLDDAREERARWLISDSDLGIEAISSQLGYSDDRAFRRAFKRWTGQTPVEFRQYCT